MKKIALLSAYLVLLSIGVYATPLDSLKQQLQIATDDATKANLYTQLANCYISSIVNTPNAYIKRINQENAINYTMLGMRLYSKQSDTTGLITSYSNLSKTYRTQHKYVQAKWFILQANTLSRRQNATASVVSTLIDLADIKMDIKDYTLAKKDLKEAHRVAMANNLAGHDSTVKLSYTRLYTYIQVPPSENVFQGLDESIKKEELAYAARQKQLAAATKLATRKTSSKKKSLAASNKRGAPIKITIPAIYWETPQNSAAPDSLRTAAL